MTPFPKEQYASAVAEESALRGLAFLDITEDVCGMELRQMTLRDLVILDSIRSPFVCGGRPGPEDIVNFLLIMSPGFKPGTKATLAFSKRCRKLQYEPSVKDIYTYVERTFMDSPGGGSGRSESYYSMAASVIDVIASEYGWDDSKILGCNLRRLFQYFNAIKKRKDPKAILFNPLSGAVRREWVKELNRN